MSEIAVVNGSQITGQSGTITFGAVAIKITKWTMKKTASPINVSDNGSGGFSEFKPAKLINWNGTFTGFMRKGVASPPFNAVVAFVGLADTGITYEGSVIIGEEGFEVDTIGGNAVQVSRNFQGSGVLTETNGLPI